MSDSRAWLGERSVRVRTSNRLPELTSTASVHERGGDLLDALHGDACPLLNGELMIGVLDLDSPSLNRFDAEDQAAFERLVAFFVDATEM